MGRLFVIKIRLCSKTGLAVVRLGSILNLWMVQVGCADQNIKTWILGYTFCASPAGMEKRELCCVQYEVAFYSQ